MSVKILGCKSYGSIAHLPNSRLGPGDHSCEEGQAAILTRRWRDRHDLVIVQEKLDGSNCAVAKVGGVLHPLSRSGNSARSSSYEQHQHFAVWTDRNWERFDKLLNDGEWLVGEWLSLAHGTKYKLTHEPFVPFDLMHIDSGTKVRLTYHNFLLRVLPLGFTVPRLIHMGGPFPVSEALEALKTSGHGAEETEGAVWRCERDGQVEFLAKYVKHDKQDGKYLPEIGGGAPIWHWRP